MILESLKIRKTASGKLGLELTENVNWETFPEKASAFLKAVKGKVLVKLNFPDMRMWLVLIKWKPFFLTFDDFPWGMSLDPIFKFGDRTVRQLYKELSESNF